MERKHGVAKRAHLGTAVGVGVLVRLLLVGNVALHGIVLQIVCGCDLGQQSGDHFDDIGNGHCANLVFGLMQRRVVEDAGLVPIASQVGFRKLFYVSEIPDVDHILLGNGRGGRGRN